MLRHLAKIFALACACFIVAPNHAMAQSLLEKLVLPGPVIKGHAKFEAECKKCHVPFSRVTQPRLCLDCHKKTAADVRMKAGFHGRQPEALKLECRHCHTEHKGRDADVVQLDRETFDHSFTNFLLKEAHRRVQCDECHLPRVSYRKAPRLCVGCHEKSDPHKKRLGRKCDSCHTQSKWNATKPFDHAKTKFALKGAHKQVGCATCHVAEKYKGLPLTCVSCHRLQDVHSGRFGPKCELCHDETKWKSVHFDHDKTKYPLRGAHKRVDCDTCHKGPEKLATACFACHKNDDPHKRRLGPRCENCHRETNWRQLFRFDHDLTRFPLIGLHSSVPCEECHGSTSFKAAPMACQKCHKDGHQGRLGAKCEYCHNPNGWLRWRFYHTTQTNYPLSGAHQRIKCEACHAVRNPPNLKLSTDCVGCHNKDDAHRGSFGQSCERCHTTIEWRRVNIRQ